ncbi:phytanoyl-CoA dioxygenase family protein [Siccirubricoccus sp. KC 17139]|uniref:Phytanoyl-CoA dioxygenase family protein n=1 Tax=Siccirubricoccus soli TaxID=2899147 RepID=A0ABT1D049_9PROT|nr:phytanoyl-CoA dioxygenase family protein [Siccirubricoccus soli]MCO6415278.1 phytanoyl-CoA dioxygenase family protein [Siccirubricoccus soli]MCP2681409.1 phytanoyl-CoA dioxygenase family protein [Siccirubricoccus soli]
MAIRGSIDRLDELLLEGWAVDDDHPETKLAFDVIVNDKVIGRFVADLFRQDLKDAEIADGECAFSFQMPQFFGRQDLANLKIRFADSNLFLTLPTPTSTEELVRPTVSRFGGLWVDRTDFLDKLGLKHRTGKLNDALAARLLQFARDGFTVIEKAVQPKLVDRLRGELDDIWHTPPAGLLTETFEPDGVMRYVPPDARWRAGRTKLLDIYTHSDAARQVIAAPAVVEFLAALFEDKPKAFQSLNFHTGLQQPMHKDTAYVKVDGNPLALAATWTALEDIEAGTGELEYFIGSHRAPDFLFGGFSKWMENFSDEHQAFLDSVLADAKTYQQTRGKFLAKKGDVLVWHADLANGNPAMLQRDKTRQSLVTHFCPAKLEPFYRRSVKHEGRSAPSCDFISQYQAVK